jgi:hypothetical protein
VRKSAAGTTPVVMSTILTRPPVFEVRRCIAAEVGLVCRRNPIYTLPPERKCHWICTLEVENIFSSLHILAKISVSDPDLIRSVGPDPELESGSGYMRAKMTHKN